MGHVPIKQKGANVRFGFGEIEIEPAHAVLCDDKVKPP
jgi:hypothetical protein